MQRAFTIAIVGIVGLCLRSAAIHAQTQLELNENACTKFDAADREMTGVYKQLLAKGANDREFLANLRGAQRAWLGFRDAQLKLLYGARDTALRYGSVWPMCACDAKASLTKARTQQLNAMVERIDGDTCSWSRP